MLSSKALLLRSPILNLSRLLHTSCTNFNRQWRILSGMPLTFRNEPEMRDTPDFTFLDGRPTPIGRASSLRIKKQQAFGEKVVTLLGHVNYALKREQNKEENRRLQEEYILSRKLKPKGVMYKKKQVSTEKK